MRGETPSHFPSRRFFEVGWDGLSDQELVALLLAPGRREGCAMVTAHRLLEAFKSPQELAQADFPHLRRLGLRQKRAMALLAALHLARRMDRVTLVPGQVFRSSIEVFRHFNRPVANLKKECFWCLLLDGKNRILRVVRISEGSLTSSLVHPREVFRPAVREAAAGTLFVHNHPSGDPAPSQEDVRVTRRLTEAGTILGIRVLDHVIIGWRGYFSFADRGLLQDGSGREGHPRLERPAVGEDGEALRGWKSGCVPGAECS